MGLNQEVWEADGPVAEKHPHQRKEEVSEAPKGAAPLPQNPERTVERVRNGQG